MRCAPAVMASAVLLAACANAPEMYDSEDAFTYAEPTMRSDAASPPITRYADQNRDGQVTRDEARNSDAVLAQNFDRYDLDRNGVLSRGEFARLEAESRERPASTSPARNEPLAPAEPPIDGSETLNRFAPGRPGNAEAP